MAYPEYIFNSDNYIFKPSDEILLGFETYDLFGFFSLAYFEATEYIAKILSNINAITSAFLYYPDTLQLYNVSNFLLIIFVPYFLCFMISVLILNAMDGDKIFICSFVSLLVITFSIVMMIVINQSTADAGISNSLEYISAFSIVNMFLFMILYFFIISIFGRFSEEKI
jgi:hypothetical protein